MELSLMVLMGTIALLTVLAFASIKYGVDSRSNKTWRII
jgi:hypothetical protein